MVQLRIQGPNGGLKGTGFVVDDRQNLLVTSCRLVEDAKLVEASAAGSQKLRLLGWVYYRPAADLAILKFDAPPGIVKALPLAAALPRKGQDIAVLNATRGPKNALSRGTVGAVEPARSLIPASEKLPFAPDMVLVQTDATTGPAANGGPLFSLAGEVLGVVSAYKAQNQAANFAIGVDEVRKVVEVGRSASTSHTFPIQGPRQSQHVADINEVVLVPPASVLNVGQMFVPHDAFGAGGVELRIDGGTRRAWVETGANGTVAWFHPNDTLGTVAEYSQGRLHGKLMARDNAGRPSAYMEFVDGSRNGWLIHFQDGSVRLIARYEKNRLIRSHLVRESAVVATHDHQTVGTPKPETTVAIAEVNAFYKALTKDEIRLRGTLRQHLRANELAARREKARANGPAKRNEAAARDNARRSAFFQGWLVERTARGFNRAD